MFEQSLDIKKTLQWFISKRRFLIIGILVCTVVMTVIFYMNQQRDYNNAMKERMSKEQLEAVMDKKEARGVVEVQTIDELMAAKSERVDELSEKEEDIESAEDIDESLLLEKEELIQRIYWLSQLRAMYFIDFTDHQKRYYNLVCGIEDAPIAQPAVTPKLMVQGAMLGVMATLVVAYLVYVFGGVLHSEQEIKKNFKYPMCTLKSGDDEKKRRIALGMECERMECEGNAVVVSCLKNEMKGNQETLDAAQEILGGDILSQVVKDINEQEKAHETQQAYIVARINETKIANIRKAENACKDLNVKVKGIIVITE